MSTPSLIETQPREGTGTRVARRERAAGRIPVIVYGHGEGSVARTVDAHTLDLAFATTSQVFTLGIDGKKESCLVKEVQYDTYGQHVLHVDFTRIDLTEEVHVEVKLEFRGDPVGVIEGGTQIIHHPALAVKCRADSIPDSLVVDVSGIAIGHGIHASEVELPAGVTLDEDEMPGEEQVVGVVPPRVEEPEEPEEGEEGAEGEEGEEGEAKAEGEGEAEGDEEKKDDGED